MAATIHVPVHDASQVGEARRAAGRVAADAGLDETRAAEATIVATELANNLHRYGGGGHILLRRLEGTRALEIIASDRGAGMADVSRCLSDGYSTGGTPGNGLGAVKRLSAEFDVFSLPDKGTVVLSRIRQDTPTPGPATWGAVSQFAPTEEVCGDTW